MINRLPVLLLVFLLAVPLYSQDMTGKWLLVDEGDGTRLALTLLPNKSGSVEFATVTRRLAMSYGEGSQFWGTFHTKGGYYFLLKADVKTPIKWKQTDSSLVIAVGKPPRFTVTATLDEKYSTREISDEGLYKKQVLEQWRRDFRDNDDVRKDKRAMEAYFKEAYWDTVYDLFDGEHFILECTDSRVVFPEWEMTRLP